MNNRLEDYLKLFSSFFNRWNLTNEVFNVYEERLHGKDEYTVLNFIINEIYKSIERLKGKIPSDIELYKMKLSHYGIIQEIEQKFFRERSIGPSRLYWDSWLRLKKYATNGEGLIRINFATCCTECYLIHRNYMSFDVAIELQVLPFEHCKNHSFCHCVYLWKPESEKLVSHPWTPDKPAVFS